jgi:hypothetical protein
MEKQQDRDKGKYAEERKIKNRRKRKVRRK